MTQEQYAMAAGLLAAIDRTEREIEIIDQCAEEDNIGKIFSTVELDNNVIRPLTLDYVRKVQKALKSELERLKQTFEEL